MYVKKIKKILTLNVDDILQIILPSENGVTGQADRPGALQIQISKMTLTNCRSDPKATYSQLQSTLTAIESGRLFSNTDFPNDKEDLIAVPKSYRKHLDRKDDAYLDPSVGDTLIGRTRKDSLVLSSRTSDTGSDTNSCKGMTYYNMSTDSLKLDSTKDVWAIAIDQFWMEFVDVPSSRSRPVPFVESFPMTLWLVRPLLKGSRQATLDNLPNGEAALINGQNGEVCTEPHNRSHSRKLLQKYYSEDEDDTDEGSKLGDIHLIVKIDTKVALEINHYQYLFLLRLLETMTNFQTEIFEDTKCILEDKMQVKTQVVSVVLKELEIALVCPPIPEMPGLVSNSPDDSIELRETDFEEEEEKMNVLMARTRELCEESALGKWWFLKLLIVKHK